MIQLRHMREDAKFDPEKLAAEIAAGLKKYRRGAPDRLLPIFDFYEGELELIVEALRGMQSHQRLINRLVKPKKPAQSAE
jgi:hypothetical protein